MPQVLGRRRRPRILVLGVQETGEFGQHLVTLAPTVKFLEGSEHLATVRQADWDVAVLWDMIAPLESHLFVLQFGGNYVEQVRTDSGLVAAIAKAVDTVATQFVIPDELPSSVGSLVRNGLAPVVMERTTNTTINWGIGSWMGTKPEVPDFLGFIKPFLTDPDGKVLAGRYQRPDSPAEWWHLPAYTPNPERWVAAAIDHWRSIDAEAFPAEAAWQSSRQWQTPTEIAAIDEIDRLGREKEAVLQDFEGRLAAAEVDRREAAQAADDNERRLLTAQGDDLVQEVMATLGEFGFNVVDVDATISAAGDRREDLRVQDSDVNDWLAIVEVRGYARGAQLNDLLRLSRFVTRYVKDEHREPSAVWYLVNQFLDTNPSTRPAPLEANQAEVETFAEDGGLVLDSRDLFQLRMCVRRQEISAADARKLMRDAAGRLDLK